MRRFGIGWFWLSLTVLAAGGSRATAGAGGWADGLFAERQHDFGNVPRGSVVRHPFVLTNNTTSPIMIVDLRVSCGCTSGKASVSVVEPGKAGVVEAQMDTRNFVGRKATTLYVTLHNGSEESEVAINVSSTILSDIVLNPGGLDFGTIFRGKSPTLSLTIDRVGQAEWRVVKMVSASKVLNATLAETRRANGLVGYRLDVSIKPDAKPGVVRDEIQLLTNDPESRGFPIMVSAIVQGDLSASPTNLSLTPSSTGPAQGRYIVRASKPFKVLKVEGTGEGFGATIDADQARPLHVVTVAFRNDPDRPLTAPTRTFQIVTDLPGEPAAIVTATLQHAP